MRRRKTIEKGELLKSKPYKNGSLRCERNSSGETLIIFRRKKTVLVGILARFLHLPQERKITLDKIGSEVWELCNGQNTVSKIIKELGLRHSLDTKDTERSVTVYLGELSRRGMIGLKT